MRKIFTLVTSLLIATITHTQVQEAWTKVSLEYIKAYSDGSSIVLDAGENVYAGVNTSDFNFDDDVPGLVRTFQVTKLTSSGTQVYQFLEPVAVFNKYLVGMAVDASGNVYCGVYESRVIDPVNARLASMFAVYKYNASGSIIWKRSYADGESNRPFAMALDAAGNVYLTGSTNVSGLVQNNNFLPDYLTVKWDAAGNLKWARKYNGADPGDGFDSARDIVVDGSGRVYITGISQRDGQLSYATLKYDANGNQLWAQRYTGSSSGDDHASQITIDLSGFVYVTGESEGTMATVKYNNDGAFLWAAREGTTGAEGSAIKVDGAGAVYVTGKNTSTQMAVIKYRFDGVKLWTATRTASVGNSIALDASGNVYVGGTTNGDGLTIKYNSQGATEWFKTNDSPLATGINSQVLVSPDYNVYVLSFVSLYEDGNAESYFISDLHKYTQCTISMPARIEVSTEPGLCGATVTWSATTTGDCGDVVYQSLNGDTAFTSGSFLNAGHYHLVARSLSTGAEAPFTIYVNDEQVPVISCPGDLTVNADAGVCYATVSTGTATALDNCSTTVRGTRSDGLALTAHYPVGVTTIEWIASDRFGNADTCTQTITVVDNQPPVISNESASTYVLSPPNHTMRDVAINYTVSDNCSVIPVITVTSNEPVNGTGDGDTDPDWIIVDNHSVKLRAERAANGNGRVYTITITATDPAGNSSVEYIQVKVPHDVKKPNSGQPFIVGSTVNFEGEFWDVPGTRHTAKWMIDDATTAKASVTEPSGNRNGKVTGSYKFTAPGVYKLKMNITDQNGLTTSTNTRGDLEAIVVVYDPNGGHTYGGGYFDSPAGALAGNVNATGKASYGFAMNYFKNSTNPKGETQFEFKVGAFEFNALNFEYLVINNHTAQFKGTGKITGGQSGIGFIMTVIDGQLDGSGIDKIRMKIYNKNTGVIIYDNQPGASDAALPTLAVGSNSVIVISGNNGSNLTGINASQPAVLEATGKVPTGLDVVAYPNPSGNYFSLSVQTGSKETIIMQVADMYGRVIETRNVPASSLIRFGDQYKPGSYFVRIIQGDAHKELKLIKLVL